MRKEKDVKEVAKKDTPSKDPKGNKELDKKKEEPKKTAKEVDVKRDKLREVKDLKKDHKLSKGRPKGKEEEEIGKIQLLIREFSSLSQHFIAITPDHIIPAL